MIVSDWVFSKGKSLITNNKSKPRYNNTLAIRGTISDTSNNFNDKDISLFLGADFHHVIYPVNPNGNLNFIAIIKHKLSAEEKKNY